MSEGKPSAEPKPPTDEELDETEHLVAEWDRLFARHPAVAENVRGSRLYSLRLVEPEIVRRLVAEVRRLRDLRTAALRYDEAIQQKARDGRSWTASPELDRLYEEWIALCGDGPRPEAFEPSVPLDPGLVPSDGEVNAAEALVRAAIRWTDVAGPTKVVTSFDLLMVELRRLRLRG